MTIALTCLTVPCLAEMKENLFYAVTQRINFYTVIWCFSYKFQFVDRTLCPMDKTRRLNMTTQQHIFVDVATMSNSNISFSLMAKLLPDFELV